MHVMPGIGWRMQMQKSQTAILWAMDITVVMKQLNAQHVQMVAIRNLIHQQWFNSVSKLGCHMKQYMVREHKDVSIPVAMVQMRYISATVIPR